MLCGKEGCFEKGEVGMNIFEKVLSRPELAEHPPVLLDIGASGKLHESWKKIAKYSICIAFDADEREFSHTADEKSHYRKLHVINKILVDRLNESGESAKEFYLTSSPYCSSILEPDIDSLSDWEFGHLFETWERKTIETTTLGEVLDMCSLDRVDWFKTDSQGIDLRLFQSLGDQIYNNVLVAEFEPGIIDAYKSEDKLWKLMAFMDTIDFWMEDIVIKGSQRLKSDLRRLFCDLELKLFAGMVKTSPGWAEVAYLNSLSADLKIREYLLLWVFSTIKQQHSYALEVAVKGHEKFNDVFFLELKRHSMGSVRKSGINLLKAALLRIVSRVTRLFR
jgi:hypothetical protein